VASQAALRDPALDVAVASITVLRSLPEGLLGAIGKVSNRPEAATVHAEEQTLNARDNPPAKGKRSAAVAGPVDCADGQRGG